MVATLFLKQSPQGPAGRWARTLTLVATFLISCQRQPVAIRVTIDARTNQGDPILGAQVLVDGAEIGVTDRLGAFGGEMSLAASSKHRLEVRKDSDEYYFAPYFDAFIVDESTPQSHAFAATLYFVPKPKPLVDVSKNGDEPREDPAQKTAALTVGVPSESDAPPRGEAVASTGVAATALPDIPSVEASPVEGREEKGGEATSTPIVASDLAVVTPLAMPDTAVEGATTTTPSSPDPDVSPTAPGIVAEALPEPLVFTVHVFGEEASPTPLDGAVVRIGMQEGRLSEGCITNGRGRCVLRFTEAPTKPVTLVASHSAYKTATRSILIKPQGKLRFTLPKGQTLDIYAMKRSFGRNEGLENVQIEIGGKAVGATDRFGLFSYTLAGKREDLIGITMRAKGVLPEVWETDFVAAGPLHLFKYFATTSPPAPRVGIVPMRMAGSNSADGRQELSSALDAAVRTAAQKHLFASLAFQAVAARNLDETGRASGRSWSEWLRTGWDKSGLRDAVDALVVPTWIAGPTPALELAVVDAQAQVLAAAREDLESPKDMDGVERAMAVLCKKIVRTFPFEGAVLGREGDKVSINIGQAQGRGLKPGDTLDVFGTQTSEKGGDQTLARIAALSVRDVQEAKSIAVVTWRAPRATIERGDLVSLRPRPAAKDVGAQIRIVEGVNRKAVSQANVYLNERWLGATDAAGRIWADITGSGTLRVVKSGFAAVSRPSTFNPADHLEVVLTREVALIKIDSQPTGASVKIDGNLVGKTPLSSPVTAATGFVHITLDGVSGFKAYDQVLELDEGALELVGPRAIVLERDIVATALELKEKGDVTGAAAALSKVSQEHSDFLLAQFLLGDLYLNQLNDPEHATAAFAGVTNDPAVAQFVDKRFIGAFVNLGIAWHRVAETSAKDNPKAAHGAWLKAADALDAAVPHLRFVPPDQYAQAVHEVDYHRALVRHRLWQATSDPGALAEAAKSWRVYLDGSARVIPAAGPARGYVENAHVYYKQVQASLAGQKGTRRQ